VLQLKIERRKCTSARYISVEGFVIVQPTQKMPDVALSKSMTSRCGDDESTPSFLRTPAYLRQ
jgi:hypothetical protein